MDNTNVKLTKKQKKLVHRFVETGNATQSAIYAGYSKKSAKNNVGYTLSLDYVKKYMSKVRAEKEKREAEYLKKRTIVLDEAIYEMILKSTDDYSEIKKIVENAILRESALNAESADDWLKRNKRKNLDGGIRYKVLERANFRCEACGVSPKIDNECVLEVDHIIPLTLGGGNNITNFQCLCRSCNASKGNRYSVNNHEMYVGVENA